MQAECVATFVCDEFFRVPAFNSVEYWQEIKTIICQNMVKGVFVTMEFEVKEWALRKQEFLEAFGCKIFLNDYDVCEIAACKLRTHDFFLNRGVEVPEMLENPDQVRPCIIKPKNGMGSVGIQVLRTWQDLPAVPFDSATQICQHFIEGVEYTVDVLSDSNGRVLAMVPKRRLMVKWGQAFKSQTVRNPEVIAFVTRVCEVLGNRSAINVQVLQAETTGKVYLVEVNPRFATTLGLTIRAGAHLPKMLIEGIASRCRSGKKI